MEDNVELTVPDEHLDLIEMAEALDAGFNDLCKILHRLDIKPKIPARSGQPARFSKAECQRALIQGGLYPTICGIPPAHPVIKGTR